MSDPTEDDKRLLRILRAHVDMEVPYCLPESAALAEIVQFRERAEEQGVRSYLFIPKTEEKP
jgi:hypothetical protein